VHHPEDFSQDDPVAPVPARRPEQQRLTRRGITLEVVTLGWNVVGVLVLAFAAIAAGSVALAAFGLDSLIEIGASTVVIWQLTGASAQRQRVALRLIGWAFLLLAAYLVLQGALVLALQVEPDASPLGIGWTAATALAMLVLAWGKKRVGVALSNPVLVAESRVTLVDALLASAILAGLVLNAAFGWWWADPLAALVLVFYALREGVAAAHNAPAKE